MADEKLLTLKEAKELLALAKKHPLTYSRNATADLERALRTVLALMQFADDHDADVERWAQRFTEQEQQLAALREREKELVGAVEEYRSKVLAGEPWIAASRLEAALARCQKEGEGNAGVSLEHQNVRRTK